MTEEDPAIEVQAEVDEEDIESLRQALSEERAKAENYLANWQRTQADFINYKRRTEHENEESRKFANSVMMLNLLPAIDDLERAFNSIPPRLSKAEWVDGIRLIERKLITTLEAQGLFKIDALGEPFDPNFHEAVGYGKGRDGIVIEEIQKGYKLHDRILRPSKVLVGNGEEEENKED